jgi:GR25 family glycosyltransferase involved in LPS biosynthesis
MIKNETCEFTHDKTYNKAIVINLDSSIKRLTNMTQQFNSSGIEFERFSAINGYTIKITDLKITKPLLD